MSNHERVVRVFIFVQLTDKQCIITQSLGHQAECSNIVQGTQQVLMQWNKNMWSLFLHILPDFNRNRTENVA